MAGKRVRNRLGLAPPAGWEQAGGMSVARLIVGWVDMGRCEAVWLVRHGSSRAIASQMSRYILKTGS